MNFNPKVYLNLISLYTESHYRQCVGEDQHFNVIHDPSFFADEKILQQLPNMNNQKSASESNESTHDSNKKESIFFSKTSDDSRTYFINGKPIRMSSVNRPVTVKDLRQQFQQQTSFSSNNSSEEGAYQQRSPAKSASKRSSRSNENKNWGNEAAVKTIPTPRSFDTFGISSDDDDEEADDNADDEYENEDTRKRHKSNSKQDVEKTLVKRRYDSDVSPTSNAKTSSGQNDADTHKQSRQYLSRKSQPASSGRVN